MRAAASALLLALTASGCYCCHAAGLAPRLPRLAALLVCAVAVVWLARACLQQLRMYWMTRHLPGPSPTWPLFGNFFQVFARPQEDIMDHVMDLRERFGPTFRVWAGPYLAIFCCEPQDLQAIFSHEHLQTKGSVYAALPTIMGDGLITLDSSHQRRRKAISPALHMDIIRSFTPAFAAQGRKLNKVLKRLSRSGETFNAMELTERAVSRAACETMLGPVSEEVLDEVGEGVREGSKLVMFVLLRPWFQWSDLCFRLLAPEHFQERERLYHGLDGLVRGALDIKEGQLQDEERSGGAKELVEHILTGKKAALIEREELVADLKHLLLGGIASSADLLALLMLALALTPDVQDKVHQELDEVFADNASRPVTAADLSKLRYLDMTMKEVLRYFPVVPGFTRNAADDVTLPSGTVVPRGSMAVVFVKAVHWDPRWYPHPSVFNPDRHQPEVAETRPNFTYIPFSAGSRGCIGQRYGMLLSKTIAATVLREYRFLPAGVQRLRDLKLHLGVSLDVHGGVNVRVQRRQRPS